MIKTALSRRLLAPLFCTRQTKRQKSTTDDVSDLKSVKHIRSVTIEESGDGVAVAKSEVHEALMIKNEQRFTKYIPNVS